MNGRTYEERRSLTRARNQSGASSARITHMTKRALKKLLDVAAFEVRSEDELIYELVVAELARRKVMP